VLPGGNVVAPIIFFKFIFIHKNTSSSLSCIIFNLLLQKL
jgi:hypothetical protein